MQEKFERIRIRPIPQIKQALIEEAQRMHAEDIAANQAMGRHGATLMPSYRRRADALQCRRAGNRGIRHGAGSDSRGG